MDRFTTLLLGRSPGGAPAVGRHRRGDRGAAWQFTHHYVAHNATHQLPQIASQMSYLDLAPISGGEKAVERTLWLPAPELVICLVAP